MKEVSEQLVFFDAAELSHANEQTTVGHLGRLAHKGFDIFKGTKLGRRTAGASLALATLIGGGYVVAPWYGRQAGHSAATALKQDMQGYSHQVVGQAVGDLKSAAKAQLPGWVQQNVAPILNLEIENVELKYGIDLNHDGIIGPPKHTAVPPPTAQAVAVTPKINQ